MKNKKAILDACCGGRMFWFDKNNPDVLFADIRQESHVLCDGRKLEISPDIIMDFTEMPFEDNTFEMVVMDPPHMNKLGKNTWMAQKYGVLLPSWETDIRAGTNEAMRVLKPGGTFIFKWNEAQVNLNQVLACIDHKPLFGHVTGKHGKTIWLCFRKSIIERSFTLPINKVDELLELQKEDIKAWLHRRARDFGGISYNQIDEFIDDYNIVTIHKTAI